MDKEVWAKECDLLVVNGRRSTKDFDSSGCLHILGSFDLYVEGLPLM